VAASIGSVSGDDVEVGEMRAWIAAVANRRHMLERWSEPRQENPECNRST
jgi:hypothetical protein